MPLSHVCHSWRQYVGISWDSVELSGGELPRQLSWIRKQPCQNVLQVSLADRATFPAMLNTSCLTILTCPSTSTSTEVFI